MTNFIDGAAVFEAREAAARASAEGAREPVPQPSALGWSPRLSVGPDTSAFTAPVDPGPAIDAYLDRSNPDVLATGRSQTGAPRHMSELKPTDLVTINGTPLEVRSALRLGYLDGGPGNYRDTGLAAKEAGRSGAQEAPKAEVKPDYTGNETPLADHNTEKLLEAVAGATSAEMQIRALNDAVALGDVSADTIRAMASVAGVEPQQVEAHLAQIQNAFADQAATALMDMGVGDPQAFDRWAETNCPSDYKEAMRRHVLDRNPKAYEKLALRYRRETADDFNEADLLEASSSAGVKVRKTPSGELVVHLPGVGETSLASARRNGWINIRRG